MCYNACGIIVHKEGNLLVKIEGDPDNPQNYGRLCAKGRAGLQSLYDPHRVKSPLRRRNPENGIKTDPQWEPKYLACSSGFALPKVLKDLTGLVGGGMRGIVGV